MPNYLKELSSRGLTLTEFARRAKISTTYAAAVFSGKSTPSAKVQKRIEEVLAVCPWCKGKWPHALPKGLKAKA